MRTIEYQTVLSIVADQVMGDVPAFLLLRMGRDLFDCAVVNKFLHLHLVNLGLLRIAKEPLLDTT